MIRQLYSWTFILGHKNMHLYKDLYISAHSSFICNIPKPENTWNPSVGNSTEQCNPAVQWSITHQPKGVTQEYKQQSELCIPLYTKCKSQSQRLCNAAAECSRQHKASKHSQELERGVEVCYMQWVRRALQLTCKAKFSPKARDFMLLYTFEEEDAQSPLEVVHL